jgi:hypothetical protein
MSFFSYRVLGRRAICEKALDLVLTTQTLKKHFFMTIYLVDWQYAQVHQNFFFATLDYKKYIFL